MRANGRPPALRVSELSVEAVRGALPIVTDVSLELAEGEVIGIVGESGSGKTTTGFALLGYSRRGLRISNGTVEISGEGLDLGNRKAVRDVRRRLVSHIPQDPGSSLNPSLRVGAMISLLLSELEQSSGGTDSVRTVFDRVRLPSTDEFLRRFPHQLSGGQQQRVLIGAAVCREPKLIILDEPTTGLDVVTQARILEEVKRLNREIGVAMIYVSHDLAVVSQVANRVAVMYAGRIVEEGPVAQILSRPRHPYTRGLVGSIPDPMRPRRLLGIPGTASAPSRGWVGCAFAPRCTVKVDQCERELPPLDVYERGTHRARCFEAERIPPLESDGQSAPAGAEVHGVQDWYLRVGGTKRLLDIEQLSATHGHGRSAVEVVHEVSFSVARAESLALVGSSGSGKTTLARCIAGLHVPSSGRILLDGELVRGHAKDRAREMRRRMQIVFQNPYESLNPKTGIGEQVARAAQILRQMSRTEAREEATRLLDRVHLSTTVATRRPGELSGGQRQRVAIARALAAAPDVLICDEVTSALDVSVQAAVIALLDELRVELGMALLFITHDLGVVRHIANRMLVLDDGRICEEGPVDAVFSAPQHPRTRELLESAPTLLGPVMSAAI